MDSEKERARDNDNRIRYKPVLTFDLSSLSEEEKREITRIFWKDYQEQES